MNGAFLRKLNTGKGNHLLGKIKQRQKLDDSFFSTDQYLKGFEPHKIIVANQNTAGMNAVIEYLENKVARVLPHQYKEEASVLVTKICGSGGWSASPEQFGLDIPQKKEHLHGNPKEDAVKFVHELTHLKHFALIYATDFQDQLDQINKDHPVPKNIQTTGYKFKHGKHLWIPPGAKVKKDSVIREVYYPKSDLHLVREKDDMFYQFGSGPKRSTMNPCDRFKIFEKSHTGPNFGFWSAYATVDRHGYKTSRIGKSFDLGMKDRSWFAEEVTEAAENSFKRGFEKVLKQPKKGAHYLSMDEKDDKYAKHPALRKKTRLFVEYGIVSAAALGQDMNKYS